MSLNAELNGFLKAYSTVSQVNKRSAQDDYYKSLLAAKNNVPGNPNSPASKWINGQVGAPPPGYNAGAVPTSGGAPGGVTVAPDPTLSGVGAVDPSQQVAQDVAQGDQTYDDGGTVQPAPLPAFQYPGQSGSAPPPVVSLPALQYPGQGAAQSPVAASSQDEPPIVLPPPPEKRVAPKGKDEPKKRKALDDQTRTEAYDPDLDGPLPASAVPTSATPTAPSTQAPVSSSAVPIGATAPTNTNAGGDGLNPQGSSMGDTNNVRSDLENALHGGMQFAQNTFHLNDPQDPHGPGGKQALFSGVGAATPDVVKAVDDRVNAKMPGYDAQLYAIRRLEATYRWYSMNGDTASANKAAFELMQQSAGVASQWGARAVDQYRAGDVQGAIKSIQQGYNHIPDGNKMVVDGNTAHIVDARTGKVVQSMPFTPNDVFNAAMGLDSRSLYWNVLAQRVAGAQQGKQSTRTQSQQDLDRARTYRILNPIAKGGRAGPAPPSGAAQALIDKIAAMSGGSSSAPSPKAQGDTDSPDGATRAGSEEDDGTDNTEDRPGEDAGGKPNSLEPTVAPDSVVRVRPGLATIPAESAAKVPLLAPKVVAPPTDDHPGFVEHDPDEVPDVTIAHDGDKYVAPQRSAPTPFDETPPQVKPYRDLLADAAKLPTRDRVAVLSVLNKNIAAQDKEVAQYAARKKTFDTSELKRIATEDKAANADTKAQMKSDYDAVLKPGERQRLSDQVSKAFDSAVDRAKAGGVDTTNLSPTDLVKAQANAKPAFDNSIFADTNVDPARFKNIALDLMTSNPRPDAATAIRIAHELTRIDPNDATKRIYKPVGKDLIGNVVVTTPTFGPVHVRPETYKDISAIVKGRLRGAATKGKVDAEAAATAGEQHVGSQDLVNRVRSALTRLPGKAADLATIPKPTGRTLIDDVTSAGRGAVNLARRGAAQLPTGDADKIGALVRDYKYPYSGSP